MAILFNLAIVWKCPFHALTGFACTGCGTIRALSLLMHGQYEQALYTNPLGLSACLVLLVYVCVKVVDYFAHTQLEYLLFQMPWKSLKKSHHVVYYSIIVVCVILTVLNTYWNNIKGL